MTIKAGLVTSLYSHDIFWFYLSGLSNRIMRKIFSHWRLEPVYVLLPWVIMIWLIFQIWNSSSKCFLSWDTCMNGGYLKTKALRVKTRKGLFRKKKCSPPPKPSVPHNLARGIILERNTSSHPVLHLYQASSKYSVGYSCYRAETRNQMQTQEGEITPKVNKSCQRTTQLAGKGWSDKKTIFKY